MDESLFQNNISPLAARLRPTQFSEVIGQTGAIHLLQNLYKPTSLLLYGPPGSGKTTLALLLSKKWNIPHVHLSAISSGVKEIKELIQKAKKTGSIALFLDEIHRFSSSQQDSLLDAVEKGEIILIGASTENPAFRINRPLLSRMRIYKLEALNKEALNQIFDRGLKDLSLSVKFESEVRDYLISLAGGDARKLLGLLEAVAESCSEEDKNISLFSIKEKLSSKVLIYDRSGENHYDFISAFIKSIRGSDPDAALYYLACMLEGGEDPVFIMRRMVILASEDIGNASLYALPLATSALNAVERIGMPEARIIMAHVCTYLASCPKSNSAYNGIEKALAYVRKNGPSITIPLHLRNAPTFLHKKEGAGKDYRYPHEYPNHFIEESYFPEELKEESPQFYYPSDLGGEKKLKEWLHFLWKDKKEYL